MKTINLITILLCAMCKLHAQDVIVLRNTNMIKCRVVSIDTAIIIYEKPNEEKPLTIKRKAVAAIRYSDGSQLIINMPGITELTSEVMDSLRITNQYSRYVNTAKRQTRLGIAFSTVGPLVIGGGVGLLMLGIKESRRNTNLPDSLRNRHGGVGPLIATCGVLVMATGTGLTISGITMFALAQKQRRKAREIKTLLSFSPTVQPIPRAGNVYGSYTGLAMRVTF